MAVALLYGFYGLTQQAAHLRIERENARLREQNAKQQQELQNLNNRVNAVEDTSRKLAEEAGISAQPDQPAPRGQGGPAHPVDSAAALAVLESKTAKLERQMWIYQDMVAVTARFRRFGRSWERSKAAWADGTIHSPVVAGNITKARTLTLLTDTRRGCG
jgi:hypothetical protein